MAYGRAPRIPFARRSVLRGPRILAYGRVYENGHDLVSKKHSRPRQVHARVIIDQETLVNERLKLMAVQGADIHAVAGIHHREVDAVGEPQAREKRFFEPLLWREHSPLTTDLSSLDHAGDVLSCGGN